MTHQHKRAAVTAVLTTLIGTFFLWAASTAWASKVDQSDFDVHLEQERTHVVRDSARAEEQKALTLDILCSVKPADRRCRPGTTTP